MTIARTDEGIAFRRRHGAVRRFRHRESRRNSVFRSRPVAALEGGLPAPLDENARVAEAVLRRRWADCPVLPAFSRPTSDISSSRCDQHFAPCLTNRYPRTQSLDPVCADIP
jgi:hypothetical protein